MDAGERRKSFPGSEENEKGHPGGVAFSMLMPAIT
jgi:hypothetical protein